MQHLIAPRKNIKHSTNTYWVPTTGQELPSSKRDLCPRQARVLLGATWHTRPGTLTRDHVWTRATGTKTESCINEQGNPVPSRTFGQKSRNITRAKPWGNKNCCFLFLTEQARRVKHSSGRARFGKATPHARLQARTTVSSPDSHAAGSCLHSGRKQKQRTHQEHVTQGSELRVGTHSVVSMGSHWNTTLLPDDHFYRMQDASQVEKLYRQSPFQQPITRMTSGQDDLINIFKGSRRD